MVYHHEAALLVRNEVAKEIWLSSLRVAVGFTSSVREMYYCIE